MKRQRFILALAATSAMALWVDSKLHASCIIGESIRAKSVVLGSGVHPILPAQSSAELRKQIEQIALTAQGRVGVAMTLLETGESVGLLEEQKFPMQSVYKFPIGMAVLHQVDRGQLRLDQKVAVTKADYVRPGQHSPIRDKYPEGTTLTVRELLRYTVSDSDGSGCDVLLRLLGGAKVVMAYLATLGIQDINVLNTEKEIGQKNSVQYDNWAKPVAVVALLQKFQQGKGLSAPSQKLLRHLMTETQTGLNRIKGLLPAKTLVVHKTGSSGTVDGIAAATNDVGIVSLPNGQHLAIAIFVSDAKVDMKAREAVIAKIARAGWDYWTSRALSGKGN
jgi:beta-lactamase class A